MDQIQHWRIIIIVATSLQLPVMAFSQNTTTFFVYNRSLEPITNVQVDINGEPVEVQDGAVTLERAQARSLEGHLSISAEGYLPETFPLRGGIAPEYFLRRADEQYLPGRVKYAIQELPGRWIVSIATQDQATGERLESIDRHAQLVALGQEAGFSVELAYPRPVSFEHAGGPPRYFLIAWQAGIPAHEPLNQPWIDFAGPAFYHRTATGPPSSLLPSVMVHWNGPVQEEDIENALSDLPYTEYNYHEFDRSASSEVRLNADVRDLEAISAILTTLNKNKTVLWADPIIWSPE
ncbi:MAG: hypothetical protein AAF998_09020 [Bacteroidota bacterium]